MKNSTAAFLVSLLTPGLGYLHIGENRKFYRTIISFLSIILFGITFRLFPVFWSFPLVMASLLAIYFGTAVDCALKGRNKESLKKNTFLKICVTLIFVLTAGLTFSNPRTFMGFDRVSMAVPVMEPTIRKGEQLLVDTWTYKQTHPQIGDIVIHTFHDQKGIFLNRVVAAGGDKIEIKNGNIFINDRRLAEDYVKGENIAKIESKEMKAMIIPPDSFFLIGDNRDQSFGDSRFSGTVNLKDIKGRITYIFYSDQISRIGKKL